MKGKMPFSCCAGEGWMGLQLLVVLGESSQQLTELKV